jgi:hypothetical protein
MGVRRNEVMDHHHEEDTYFLDQLCMIALSGAFGAICLAMYFIQQGMLYRLLAPQFHPFVLASGIALLVISLVRGAVLWSEAGARRAGLAHAHLHPGDDCCHGHDDGGHDHAHAHSHAFDDHGPSHAHDDHGHSHAHAHSHSRAPAPSHSHSHGGHADHDHAWAPWRYVVLLVPIILFLLGLPSRPPQIVAQEIVIDTRAEAEHAARLTGLGVDGWQQLGFLAASVQDQADQTPIPVNFKRLETMASSPGEREHWKGKTISVKGQFMPQTDRLFTLVRLSIQCCAADAVQLDVPILASEPITDIKKEEWILVTGRVDFREVRGKQKAIVLVSRRSSIRSTPPDLNPYEQLR